MKRQKETNTPSGSNSGNSNKIYKFFKPLSAPASKKAIEPKVEMSSSKESLPCCSRMEKETETEMDVANTGISLTCVDIGKVSSIIFNVGSTNTKQTQLCNISELKCKVLKNDLFVPDEKFNFPVSDMNKKKLKFQRNWLHKWPWLAYSKDEDGVFCKYCVLFCSEYVGKGANQKLGSLVVIPFRKWKDAVEKFESHNNTNYHKFSMVAAENYIKVSSGKIDDVATLLDSQRTKERMKNRALLKPIIETLIFCGENELPLRGHRDDGPITVEKPFKKEGIFRSLLRFRATTDKDLKEHLEKSNRNAMYVSPDIQNEVIRICGNLIQTDLVKSINNAECFTILGDETLDVSGKEQFSLCIRYVSNDTTLRPILKEDFVSFTQLGDLTAKTVSKTILDMCSSLGLNMDKLVGQGYDGASTFSGHLSGVHQRIQEVFPKALYVHCAAHRLNLVLSDSLAVPSIRNCLGTVAEVSNMFRNNSQAGEMLKNNIKTLVPESKKKRLLGLCETRFIERQDAVTSFIELFPAIVLSLQDLSCTQRAISTTASTLLAAVEKGSFILGLVVCDFVFNLTLPLSKYLQSPQCNLSSALRFADNILDVLKHLREPSADNDVQQFSGLFKKAQVIAGDIFQSDIDVPRQTVRQTTRDNHPHNSPEEYFRRTIFVPCLDGLISALVERFGKNRDILQSLEILIPKYASSEKVEAIGKLEMFYSDSASEAEVKSEYLLWCAKCQKFEQEDRPHKLMQVLDECDKNFYPNIHHLLCVLATLPVSTTEVERSFSSLKRIKSYLRNSMESERLTGLALMSIHYPVKFNANDVLDVMSKGNRKILL